MRLDQIPHLTQQSRGVGLVAARARVLHRPELAFHPHRLPGRELRAVRGEYPQLPRFFRTQHGDDVLVIAPLPGELCFARLTRVQQR